MSGFADTPQFEVSNWHFCCVLGREHEKPCRCECDGCEEARQSKEETACPK